MIDNITVLEVTGPAYHCNFSNIYKWQNEKMLLADWFL